MSRIDHPERSPLGERGMNVLPASQYLHERLQERRARQMRPKRARHTDIGVLPPRAPDDDIFLAEAGEPRSASMFDSSPIVAASGRASDAGTQQSERRRRPPPGVRDMDDQLDRLHKQNFALKLEIDHRRELTQQLREQIESMQEQVDRALLLEEEHKELLRINSDLVSELEKRDKAVEEAMDIICDLEDQVGELQERASATRPSTAQADSGYASTEIHDHDMRTTPPRVAALVATPHVMNVQAPSSHASAASQQLQGVLHSQTPVKPKRQPSVLSSRKPSTQALRSVYLETTKSLQPVLSFQSLLEKQESKTEDETDDLPSSPRLSVLSESSFPSIYSPKKQTSPDKYAWEAADETDGLAASLGSRAHVRQDSIKRVSQWMSARDALDDSPSKSARPPALSQNETASQEIPSRGVYQSLDNALAAPRRPWVLAPAPELEQSQHQLSKQKPARSQPRPTGFHAATFGGHNMPPTPDSVSTRMLRESRSSIVRDRSMGDGMPMALAAFDAPELGLRTAPRQMRSSVELRTAYDSNLQFRTTALDGHPLDDSSDEEYIPPEPKSLRNDFVKEFAHAFEDGIPDGHSIHKGTPTRFQSHSQPPEDIMFNRRDLSPIINPRVPARRRSSDQINSTPAKPRLGRMETSPTLLTANTGNNDGRVSIERVISPHSTHSHHSNSSGNRTVTQVDGVSAQPQSPVPSTTTAFTSPRSRTSPSPARTLSKKMPGFIRRLSSSMTSEGSPLPTLTSTPSSAYAQPGPPRPKTSHADRLSRSTSGTTVARPPSNRGTRTALPTRTKTETKTTRPASAAGTEKERKSLFKRSNSVKSPDAPVEPIDAQARTGPQRRAGSIRDAVASKRPWR